MKRSIGFPSLRSAWALAAMAVLPLALASGRASADTLPDYYASLAPSYRSGSGDVAAGARLWGASGGSSVYLEGSFVDEGRQPKGIMNINRVANVDLAEAFAFDSFAVAFKAGASSSRLSRNGSGDDYRNHSGFEGGNVGFSASREVAKGVSVEFSDYLMHYLQCDHHGYETYLFLSVGVKVAF